MKLQTAKDNLRKQFSGKLNNADLMVLYNLLEAVDETARLETEQKHIRERNRQSHG